jgi:hypothetical protein
MRSQPFFFIVIIFLFIFLTDLYAFRGLSQVSQGLSSRQRMVISGGFWMVTGIMLVWLVWLVLNYKNFEYDRFYQYFSIYFGAVVLFYVPKLFFNVFLLLNDIGGLIISLFSRNDSRISSEGVTISRADFLLTNGIDCICNSFFFHIVWYMEGEIQF